MTKWQTFKQGLRAALYPSWVRQIITEGDNQTVDVKRVMALTGALSFFYLGWHAVVINRAPFEAQSYGIGFAAMMASVGAMLALGEKSEKSEGDKK